MDNKTILVIGCSFSAAINPSNSDASKTSVPIHPEYSWPYVLSKLGNCTVINAAYPGTSLPFHASIYEDLIKKFNPDLVILQVTYSTRTTFSHSTSIKHDLTADFVWNDYTEKYKHVIRDNFFTVYNEEDNMKWMLPTDEKFKRFELSWEHRLKLYKKIIKEKQQHEDFNWFNYLVEQNTVDHDFYKNLEQMLTEDEILTFESLSYLKHDFMLEESHITKNNFGHLIDGIKYRLDKKHIPSIIFTWDSLINDSNDKIHRCNDTPLYNTNTIDFSIYDSIKDIELYALDYVLHLDHIGHQKVADIVYKYINRVFNYE